MVIRNAEVLEYVEPLKKMFPKGAYWDKLLSDENSDVSLVCRARAEAIALFRSRMNQLQREAWPDWADETISDWERVCLGETNPGIGLSERRDILRRQRNEKILPDIVRSIAETYGGTLHGWELPYRPAAFGHAQFGRARIPTIAGMWVVFVHATIPFDKREYFEMSVKSVLLANQTLFFVYGD